MECTTVPNGLEIYEKIHIKPTLTENILFCPTQSKFSFPMAVRVAENTGYHVTGVKNTLNTACPVAVAGCLMESDGSFPGVGQDTANDMLRQIQK